MSLRSLPWITCNRKQLRLALLLLMLGAFGVQQWAMQAHWHANAGNSVAAQASATDPGTDQGPGTGGAPADKDCLWCHASHGGAAGAPPAAMRLALPDAHDFVRLPAGVAPEFPAAPAHAWRSRGPPQA
ncbi:MAG: hypothetical protein ABW278_11080 [Steroidobacteraceae bacterium]